MLNYVKRITNEMTVEGEGEVFTICVEIFVSHTNWSTCVWVKGEMSQTWWQRQLCNFSYDY